MTHKPWIRTTLAAAAAALLSACGGGLDTTAASPTAQAAAVTSRAKPLAVPSAVNPLPTANQLMDFAEAGPYRSYFPGHPDTLTSGPFLYRYYAGTGVYLGVASGHDTQYADGVYVMGGEFGAAPSRKGAVTDFITPGAPFAGLWTGEVVNANNGPRFTVDGITLPTGEIMLFAVDDCHVLHGSYTVNSGSISLAASADWRGYCYGATDRVAAGWDGSGNTDLLQQSVSGSGSLAERSAATLNVMSGQSNPGTIKLNYSNLYERSSSLAKLVGTYLMRNGYTVTVAADGSFVGSELSSNGVGLVTRRYTGQFTVLDASKNIYAVTVNVGTSAMTGYAFTTDSAAGKVDDAIRLAAFPNGWGPFVHYWVRKSQ